MPTSRHHRLVRLPPGATHLGSVATVIHSLPPALPSPAMRSDHTTLHRTPLGLTLLAIGLLLLLAILS